MIRWFLLTLTVAAAACAGDGTTNPDPLFPEPDGGGGELPDGGGGGQPDGGAPLPDAPLSEPDAGGGDMGGDGLPPDPDVRFLTQPPGEACSGEVAESWEPKGGFSGGIPGTKTCGPKGPDCPTTYIPGNSGAACSSAADCTGPNPVCLKGSRYQGGTCAATGCELGSNFGCQEGGVCINGGDGQTYCVGGCGLDESGCFVGCGRDGFSCFNTESKSLGTCFAAEGVRQCNPSASATCTLESFGDGVCVQTSWDDQTVGRCFETCDPIAQDCSLEGTACYVLREYKGYPVCFQHWGFPEGSECDRMTQCDEGLRCGCDISGASPCPIGLRCRKYCALDGSTECPSDTRCTPLVPGSRWGSCLAIR
jgi:hypothetical protein